MLIFYTASGVSAKGTLSTKQKETLGPRWEKHQQGTEATLLYAVCMWLPSSNTQSKLG